MKHLRMLGMALAVVLAGAGVAQAQTGSWTDLTTQPTFNTDTNLLLTDGTVMMHQYSSQNWFRLTPDNTGSYVNGTITSLAPMPSNYKPLYFASAVLADGNVIVEGGEYNNLVQDETNLGAFYDATANTWTVVKAPTGWTEIGDSPGVVLANGTFMLGQNQSMRTALFNESTLTWTTTGAGKADTYSEEGWALLPDQTVLTVDTQRIPNAEKYRPGTGTWVAAGTTVVTLPDAGSLEIGPLLLLPTGNVFAMGGTTHTATYAPATKTWAAGPDFPNHDAMADGPAAVLVDGNVLVDTCPGVFGSPANFYEYDGTKFTVAPEPNHVGMSDTSYEGRMLALPSGQVLFTAADGSTKDAAIYTPAGSPNPAWAPTITKIQSTTLTHGKTYAIQGTQFNGLTGGAAYGDDAQMNTNYPLVRITNTGTGHVFYAKTHNHTTMAVATGAKLVQTKFDVPATIETGASTVEVVANGIASLPFSVTVN